MSWWNTDRAWRLNAVAVACAAAAFILTIAGLAGWGNPLEPFRLIFWGLPVALCAIPLAIRRPRASQVSRIAVAVVLWALSAFTFSFFFLPSAVLMLVAAASRSRTPDARPSPGA